MGNFKCAIVILILTFLLVLVNSVIIFNICDNIITLAENENTSEAVALWEKHSNYIAFFTRDMEIDFVESEALKMNVEGISEPDKQVHIIAFCEGISEIKDTNHLKWCNLF